jgi:hypothetical protein
LAWELFMSTIVCIGGFLMPTSVEHSPGINLAAW